MSCLVYFALLYAHTNPNLLLAIYIFIINFYLSLETFFHHNLMQLQFVKMSLTYGLNTLAY